MLEIIMTGAVLKTATITPGTYQAIPGTNVTFTVRTKNVKPTDTVYWAVLLDSNMYTGLSPLTGSKSPVNDVFTFIISIPVSETNTGKTFKVGVGLDPTSASDAALAMAVTNTITMQAIPIPNGQINYLSPGTYSLIVPNYVKTMSFYSVAGGGGGGSGNTSYQGRGGTAGAVGGSGYNNAVPVTAGETLTVVVGSGGALVTKGTDTVVKRGSTVLFTYLGGGPGSNGSSGGSEKGNYGQWGADGITIPGLSAGQIQTDIKQRPGASGLGGDGYGAGNSSNLTGQTVGKAGINGGMRVIWGTGRSFPSTKVTDL